jgi:hypothetical protein
MVNPQKIWRLKGIIIEEFNYQNTIQSPGIFQGQAVYVSKSKNVIRFYPGQIPTDCYTGKRKVLMELIYKIERLKESTLKQLEAEKERNKCVYGHEQKFCMDCGLCPHEQGC